MKYTVYNIGKSSYDHMVDLILLFCRSRFIDRIRLCDRSSLERPMGEYLDIFPQPLPLLLTGFSLLRSGLSWLAVVSRSEFPKAIGSSFPTSLSVKIFKMVYNESCLVLTLTKIHEKIPFILLIVIHCHTISWCLLDICHICIVVWRKDPFLGLVVFPLLTIWACPPLEMCILSVLDCDARLVGFDSFFHSSLLVTLNHHTKFHIPLSHLFSFVAVESHIDDDLPIWFPHVWKVRTKLC